MRKSSQTIKWNTQVGGDSDQELESEKRITRNVVGEIFNGVSCTITYKEAKVEKSRLVPKDM